MEYLVIGDELLVIKDDPEQDGDLMAAVEDGDAQIVRYRGNCFEELLIVNAEDGPEEDDPREYETLWKAVKVSL